MNQPNVNDVLDFQPALTYQQIQNHEVRQDVGVNRRLMLAILSKSGKELCAGFGATEQGGESALRVYDSLLSYKDYLTTMLSITNSAIARHLLVMGAIEESLHLKPGGNVNSFGDSCPIFQ